MANPIRTMPAWMRKCVMARIRVGTKLNKARSQCRRHNDPADFSGYSRQNRRTRRTRRASKRSY